MKKSKERDKKWLKDSTKTLKVESLNGWEQSGGRGEIEEKH